VIGLTLLPIKRNNYSRDNRLVKIWRP